MGEVFLGFDHKLKREVAIKAVAQEASWDMDRQRRLRREAEILASFNHPNIAQIHGLEILESGEVFLVMEYVEGRSLREVLADGPLQYVRALQLTAIIARAMELVHNRGVIHRDLKPANIQIGDMDQVKILDFGLAVAFEQQRPGLGDATTTSHLPSVVSHMMQGGTPGYMSPEQVLEKPIDQRTDVFSFGCIVYECLTGSRAFRGNTKLELARAVVEDDPDWRLIPSAVPRSIVESLRRCLARDVLDRSMRLTEIREALEAALAANTVVRPTRAQLDTSNNLPIPLGAFLGRDHDLTAIQALIEQSRVLTLTGAGGCGKTRLAIEAARISLGTFSGGVFFVPLAGVTDPAMVDSTMASCLAPRGRPPSSISEELSPHLEKGRVLFVLDNCEHVVSACRPIVETLLRTHGKVSFLITSQIPLELSGETQVVVRSLAVPGVDEPDDASEVGQYDSVRLFLQRAKLANPRFELNDQNARAVANICRRLDGMPLAIELAAARTRLLSPLQISAHLDHMLDLLIQQTPGALERHRTLRAAMDWSFGLLSNDELEMMNLLCAFSGGWDLDAAVNVVFSPSDQYRTIDLLDRLVTKSLVVCDNAESAPRFRLLESIRQYALDRFPLRTRIKAQDRHLDYYADRLRRMEQATSARSDLELLDFALAERDNLLHAQRWAFETQRDKLAMQLTTSLRRLWPTPRAKSRRE